MSLLDSVDEISYIFQYRFHFINRLCPTSMVLIQQVRSVMTSLRRAAEYLRLNDAI